MAIQERLMRMVVELKFHLAIAVALAAAVFALLSVGPSFATVVSFFWPLLVSTGFFLVAVAVLLRISPPPPDNSCGATGEELMDYVAGRPEDTRLGADDGERERVVEEEEEQQKKAQ